MTLPTPLFARAASIVMVCMPDAEDNMYAEDDMFPTEVVSGLINKLGQAIPQMTGDGEYTLFVDDSEREIFVAAFEVGAESDTSFSDEEYEKVTDLLDPA
jgi:hypothetical protein